MRITESLGPQSVSVPDVTGQTERPASLILRRLQLDPGSVAHLPAPPPVGVVLAQSPPPNSRGLNGPRVALLVSDDAPESESAAYVMPSLIGMTIGTASLKLAGGGLHIATAQSPDQPDLSSAPDLTPPVLAGAATIISQTPPAGHRVTRADTIRITLSH